MRCNYCWRELEDGVKCVATACGHLFCPECSDRHFTHDTAQCSVCGTELNKRTCRLVCLNTSGAALQTSMYGQTPETALSTALAAINFAMQQQDLSFQFQSDRMQKKMTKLHEQCKRKLQELHNGYQAAKRKLVDVSQQRDQLQGSIEELQQKYNQKCQQTKNLQNMMQQLKAENDQLRAGGNPARVQHNSGLEGLLGGGSPQGRLAANVQRPRSGQLVTTVQQRQVFMPAQHMQASPSGPHLEGPHFAPPAHNNFLGMHNDAMQQTKQHRRPLAAHNRGDISPLTSNMSLALSPGGAGNHPPGHKGGGGLRQALGMGHAPQAHARMLLSDGANFPGASIASL